MIKALIFDFDGLILDTETPWYDAYKEVLRERFDFHLPLEAFVKSVGANDEVLFAYLEREFDEPLDINELRQAAYALHVQAVEKMSAREGVVDYLKDAKDQGLQVALATSSNQAWADKHLSNLNLLSYFNHIVTSDDVEHVKPAPDLFLKAIEKLQIAPHEAVVFEDSLNGLIAASKANLQTVIVTNPLTVHLPFENYHLKLASMEEMGLDEVIQSLEEKM